MTCADRKVFRVICVCVICSKTRFIVSDNLRDGPFINAPRLNDIKKMKQKKTKRWGGRF